MTVAGDLCTRCARPIPAGAPAMLLRGLIYCQACHDGIAGTKDVLDELASANARATRTAPLPRGGANMLSMLRASESNRFPLLFGTIVAWIFAGGSVLWFGRSILMLIDLVLDPPSERFARQMTIAAAEGVAAVGIGLAWGAAVLFLLVVVAKRQTQ